MGPAPETLGIFVKNACDLFYIWNLCARIVRVIGPDERIAEIPGILLEHVVRRMIAERTEILDGKDGRRAGVALAERMHLPDLRDEPRKVRYDLRRRLPAVVVFALVGKVAYQRGLERRLVAIGDRIFLQHPFVLADVARPQLPRRRKNTAKQLRMKRNEVLQRERESPVVSSRKQTSAAEYVRTNVCCRLKSCACPNR